jgi:hypothetical protein
VPENGCLIAADIYQTYGTGQRNFSEYWAVLSTRKRPKHTFPVTNPENMSGADILDAAARMG